MNHKERLELLEKQQKEQDKEIAELKLLIQQEKDSKDWRKQLPQPPEGGYAYIDNNMENSFSIYYNKGGTKRKPEHAFKTKEQGQLVIEKILLIQEMLAFAHVRNNGWIPDWSIKKSTSKYGIISDNEITKVGMSVYVNHLVFGVAVQSEEIAKEMLEEFGERIQKYYSQQY